MSDEKNHSTGVMLTKGCDQFLNWHHGWNDPLFMPLAFLFTGPSHWQNTRFPTLTVVARQQPMTCFVNVRAFNNHPDTVDCRRLTEI